MSDQSVGRVFSIVKPLKEILKDFEVREMEGKKESLGYSFESMPVLNEAFSGLRKGHLHLFGFPASYTRRHFLLDMAIATIQKSKTPVLFLSYDKSPKDMIYELLARETGLDLSTIQMNKVKSNPDRKEKLKTGMEALAKYQGYLHILGGSQLDTPEQIEAHMDFVRGHYKVRDIILFVDSIQRIPSYQAYSSEAEKVNDLANRLKTIALSCDIPVVASSDINAEGLEIEEQDNKDRIFSKHCRGSEDLGRYADVFVSASKNWMDSHELKQQLSKKAEFLQKSTQRLPKMDVIDLHIDKSPLDVKAVDGVQILVYHNTGLVRELGKLTDQQVLRANRLDKTLSEVLDADLVEFYDPADDDEGEEEVAAMAAAAKPEKKKIKPAIKLSR